MIEAVLKIKHPTPEYNATVDKLNKDYEEKYPESVSQHDGKEYTKDDAIAEYHRDYEEKHGVKLQTADEHEKAKQKYIAELNQGNYG
jgi:hypothetical protein